MVTAAVTDEGLRHRRETVYVALVLLAGMCVCFGLGYGAGYNRGIELGRQALEAYILSLE